MRVFYKRLTGLSRAQLLRAIIQLYLIKYRRGFAYTSIPLILLFVTALGSHNYWLNPAMTLYVKVYFIVAGTAFIHTLMLKADALGVTESLGCYRHFVIATLGAVTVAMMHENPGIQFRLGALTFFFTLIYYFTVDYRGFSRPSLSY